VTFGGFSEKGSVLRICARSRVAIDVILSKQARRVRAASGDDTKQEVLGADELLVKRACLLLGRLQRAWPRC